MAFIQFKENKGAWVYIKHVLNGKRGISPRVRQALAERFKVSPALFV
jgi:hypothetical protein